MKIIVVNKSGGLDIPIGGIILWYGLQASIPAGYEIYENLKGYLPLANASIDLTARGALTHTHGYPSDALDLKANHTHSSVGNISGSAGGVGLGVWSNYNKSASQYHSHGAFGSVSGAGGHRHTLGNTGAGNNLTSYRKLYYIRRVS